MTLNFSAALILKVTQVANRIKFINIAIEKEGAFYEFR